MAQYEKISKLRSDSGILIFNKEKKIIFANQVAVSIIEEAPATQPKSQPDRFPPYLSGFYDEIKRRSETFAINSCVDSVFLKKSTWVGNKSLEMRGFIISDSPPHDSTLFLILIRIFKIRSGTNAQERCDFFNITPKQLSVLKLLVTGLKNKEIANTLGIAETTVKDHIRKVMEKMRVKTRAGIVSRFLSCSDYEMSESNP